MTSKDIKPVIEQPDTGIPLMLSQAIIVAGVLAVGELACSPLYFSLLKASLALIPWAMEAVFMAVAFTFVVGFALLWCAESFTLKMRERFRPFAYAIVGLIGYGAWSLLVFSATINSGACHGGGEGAHQWPDWCDCVEWRSSWFRRLPVRQVT